MKRLLVLLALVACAPRNDAVRFARTISKGAQCVAIAPDVALCDFGKVLAYCFSGEGKGSDCLGFADFRPKKPGPALVTDKPAETIGTDAKPAEDKPKAEEPAPAKEEKK